MSQSVDCGYTGFVFIINLTDVTDLLEYGVSICWYLCKKEVECKDCNVAIN